MPNYGTIDRDYGKTLATTAPDDDGPIWMINLMRYNEVAEYADGRETKSTNGVRIDAWFTAEGTIVVDGRRGIRSGSTASRASERSWRSLWIPTGSKRTATNATPQSRTPMDWASGPRSTRWELRWSGPDEDAPHGTGSQRNHQSKPPDSSSRTERTAT